jgi:cytoskeletal protein RodZ
MTDSQTPAPTPAVDVGSTLKKARTQRGLSLESVQQKTRIPRKFLESLENNRFQDLPATVYLRGFLRTYCEFLDVEFEPLWSRLNAEKAGKEGVEPTPAPAAPAEPPASVPPAAPSLGVIVGVAIVALGALVWIAMRATRPKAPPPLPAPPAVSETPIQPLHPKQEMTLELVFPSRTWIRVETDGRLKFEGWAPAGAKQTWKAMDKFRIRTSSPETVRTVLDGNSALLKAFPRTPAGEIVIEGPPAR